MPDSTNKMSCVAFPLSPLPLVILSVCCIQWVVLCSSHRMSEHSPFLYHSSGQPEVGADQTLQSADCCQTELLPKNAAIYEMQEKDILDREGNNSLRHHMQTSSARALVKSVQTTFCHGWNQRWQRARIWSHENLFFSFFLNCSVSSQDAFSCFFSILI